MVEPLLRVRDLSLSLPHEEETRRILDQVSFNLYPNEVLGLVGESGSGKTMTSLAIIGLLPSTAQDLSGSIWFDGRDLLALSEREMRAIRGAQIAMIFQSPRTALNPLKRAGDQVARAVRIHRKLPKGESYETAVDLLRQVGIPDAEARARAYPHQLSGGMAQRVLVAMMLACQPTLLIADEPTTGLDVTVQAQIFELIKDIQAGAGVTVLLITHDLGVVSEVCHRVAVMYAGQIMETAQVTALFDNPKHPYTERLLSSILRVDIPRDLDAAEALHPITLDYEALGCRFAAQCPYVMQVCRELRPEPFSAGEGHTVFCHKYTEEAS
jgi:peptide/nickel transport system ATP-binding protein/oligopeptide transport system ATP-binding protein